MSSFLAFTLDTLPFTVSNTTLLTSLADKYSKPEYFRPAEKIINIGSPFGLNSKELFLNIRYKGLIVNKVSENLYLTDLDGHLVNVEGSPVFERSGTQVVGVRLPSIHSFNLFMGCSLMVPLQALVEQISGGKRAKIPPLSKFEDHPQSFFEIVVKIKDGHLK